jgi:hypothetical protein
MTINSTISRQGTRELELASDLKCTQPREAP